MKLPAGLFYALLFILVFFMLFKLEVHLTGSPDQEFAVLSEAYNLTERMRSEANFEFQLQSRFDDFRERLYQNPGSLLAEGKEPLFLQSLPPHSLALAFTDNLGHVDRFVNLKGQTSREFVDNFIEIDHMVSHEQKDVFLSDEYAEKVNHADRLLSEYLGCAADRVGVKQLRPSRPALFESIGGIICLYWDSQTLINGKKAYFFSRYDLTGLPQSYPLRSFLGRNARNGVFMAFYDVAGRRFIADPNFSSLQEKPVFAAIRNSCLEIAHGNVGEHAVNVGVVAAGKFAGLVGRPMFSNGMLPIAILDSSLIMHEEKRSTTGSLMFLAAASMALFFFIQTFCFSRAMKLTVGRVLLIACLSAIFMPFMMGQSVFRLIFTAASESGRLKLERNLHNLVSGVDSGVCLFHANLLQHFRSLVIRDDSLAALSAEETAEASSLRVSPPKIASATHEQKLLLPEAKDSMVTSLAVKLFEPFLQGLHLAPDNHRKANAVVVMGAGGFTRFFDRYKSMTFTTSLLPETDPIFLILNLYRQTVERFFRPADFVGGLLTKSAPGKKTDLEQFKFEEIRRHVAASVGAEKVYSMLINFEGLNNFRTSIGLVNFAVFPVWVNNMIRYFCGISWDEFAISRVYLARVFASSNRNPDESENDRRSVFAWIDPVNYFRQPAPFIQAYGSMRGDMLFDGASESVRLGMLLKAGQRSRRTIKKKVTGNEDALYYVLPGRFFTLYVVGGRQATGFLKEIEEWRAIVLLLGALLFILFAALAAVNVSRSVSSPLEHLLWGIGMIERSDYSVKLMDSREDEFGSISRAFNMMARRLRERATLGKFVSPAVRRLAADPELLQEARNGTEKEITVLFAALEGFDQFAASAPVEQVQRKLEFALEQFYRLAHAVGGEVDKIIGGKLLIVFPHQSNDGARAAAIAAAGLARSIIRIFSDNTTLKPVFGINSGHVISGIIGAPSVRMDHTVIGDPVNVAARLCSLASSTTMPVVVSEDIVLALHGRFPVAGVDVGSIRGKKQEVRVFSLIVNKGG
ncbi:MAG TPA: adenylate/guanylate cyclase domain-containing protein [Candidatus Rifleibacterium sp.]|nr:adenylate/guanylate cyclase domain-containing protein [Candidatus Rifleibacterium sp.]HPT44957.1 adenylate/guanylate cyclase domain-containing protein [Candidatus Rifleibacterium sp.]